MDFVHDTLAGGGKIRVLSVIDIYTRECLALAVDVSFKGEKVAAVLSDLRDQRGLPPRITVDNGTEFTSRTLDHWAYWNQVKLDFTLPGKPVDNADVEAFHGTFRRECLSQHWLNGLEDARRTMRDWREVYNKTRPQISLGQQTPGSLLRRRRLHPGPDRDPKLAVLVDQLWGAPRTTRLPA